MFRVQVCATHMDPDFSNNGPFSADFPYTWVGLPWLKLAKSSLESMFLPKFIIKVGMQAKFVN